MYPPNPPDTGIDRFLMMIVMILVWGYVLLLLIRLLRRSRPGLAITGPVGLAFAIRLLFIPAVTDTGFGSSLRGGDEITFLGVAHTIASSSLGSSAWLPFGHNGLYEILFAFQLRFLGLTVDTMRITDVSLAVIGMTLIIVSVYDLVGPRPARLTGWLLALEPASIFFSQVLHKDPLMMFASGLVVFGGTKVWRRLDPAGLLLMAIGGAWAVATRPYAGWFLVGAAVFLTAHAAVRNNQQRGRAVIVLLAVAGIAVVATPVIIDKTSKQSLQTLQGSQTANSQAAGTEGNNLALESVNFSTRGAIITNLPQRIGDLLMRPWPWQIGDPSQRLGVIGTLVAYVAMGFFVLYAIRLRGRLFDLAGPLIYAWFFLLIAYSLSVGNAGTGFRYRSQLTVLVIATAVALREVWRREGVRVAHRSRSVRPARWLPAASGTYAAPNAGGWRANVARPSGPGDQS